MKFPEKLHIGYRTFKVLRRANLPGVSGSVSSDDRLIQIESELSHATDAVDTMWHEILHVLVQDSTLVSDSDEEQLVGVLANKMTELCVRNPDLLEWVLHTVKEET